MKPVTDPALLDQLNAAPALKPVTDEGVLFELENGAPQPSAADQVKRSAGLVARTAGPTLAGIGAGAAIGSVIPGVGTAIGGTAGGLAMTGAQILDALRGGDTTGALMDKLGLPRPETGPERFATDVGGSLVGQGMFTKLGQMLGNTTSPILRGIGQTMSSNPVAQGVAATTGGGAASVTKEAGGGPIAQTVANVAGSLAPAAATSVVVKESIPAEIRRLLEAARRHDVPLSFSDITGKGKMLDTALERVPLVGTASFRETGATKVTEAAQRVGAEARGTMGRQEFQGMEALELAAKNGDKQATRILNDIQNAGDDWTKIMQASGNLKLWGARQESKKLYDNVETLAQGRGDVPLANTIAALDDAIAKETASKLPDQAMLGMLTKLKEGLASGNGFSAMRALRSDLGDIIDGYYKGANAAVGGKGVGPLQGVKTAVERDMETFATQGGGDLAKAWKQADQHYREAVVPFKDRALAQALKSDTPDEVYSKFIKVSRSGGGRDRAEKFYQSLDEKGRAAVRYGMIENALNDAMIPGKQTISPAKFAKSLEDIEAAAGVFFKGQDKWEFDGFRNLMRHAERFGQYGENPPTGQRLITMLTAGAAAIEPGTTAAVGGAAYLAKLFMTTPWARDLLLQASTLKPGTPQMEQLSQRLAQRMSQITAETNRPDSTDDRQQPAPQSQRTRQ